MSWGELQPLFKVRAIRFHPESFAVILGPSAVILSPFAALRINCAKNLALPALPPTDIARLSSPV